jgi:HK97 family phage major capsid protein
MSTTSTKWKGVKVNNEFTMKAFHYDMQKLRQQGKDISLKGFLNETYGEDYSVEKFYAELGIDLGGMTVQKMLQTSDLTRYLFPEVFRDAIVRGLEYTPIYGRLVTGEERIESTGLTMPKMDWTTVDQEEFRLRDVNEGATITEGEIITWQEKTVNIKKKGRGLKQTYESLMFTPIDLARVFFEELGVKLGADLDRDLIDIALNGDQADGSEAAPVIGAATANTLTYRDIARAWTRFRRIGRNSSVMLASEADVLTILDMDEFQRTIFPGATQPPGTPTLNVVNPLPTTQDIYVVDSVTTGMIVFIDVARAFVQLTAMPLLIETEKIVSRQLNGEYVSIITGFANIFTDGRLVLDYTTTLIANPGPEPVTV